MAKIINLEDNLEFELCLKRNDMLDYNPQRNEFENWIPFTLYVHLPDRCCVIDEDVKVTMTVSEINNFINGIENVLVHLDKQENCIYKYYNSESFFELSLEVIHEDDVVEIELWFNVGNQTKGSICGFDEGVRWITSKAELNKFIRIFKCEYYHIIS